MAPSAYADEAFAVVRMNYDGTVLETDNFVPYGVMPEYHGPTPEHPADDYLYSFRGWSPDLAPVTEEIIYTACYTVSNNEGEIIRIYGDTRYDTTEKLATRNLMYNWVNEDNQFSCVIVANGLNYPDALSGCGLASDEKAPILLYNPNNSEQVENYIQKIVAPGGSIYILGGSGAVSVEFQRLMSSKGYKVTRYGGFTESCQASDINFSRRWTCLVTQHECCDSISIH